MRKRLNKKPETLFIQARLKKFSDLFLDIAKNTVIGGLASLIFDDWEKPWNKIIILLFSSFVASFFLIISLQYLRRYYAKSN